MSSPCTPRAVDLTCRLTRASPGRTWRALSIRPRCVYACEGVRKGELCASTLSLTFPSRPYYSNPNPTQSVQAFNGDSFGITGEFSTQDRVEILWRCHHVHQSTDKGATWNFYEIDGAQYARYGDFPSATTW